MMLPGLATRSIAHPTGEQHHHTYILVKISGECQDRIKSNRADN